MSQGSARGLRLALVSAYPPSAGPLSEYAWHLVESLRRSERVSELHVLADRAPGAIEFEDGNLRVAPTWTFDGFDLPLEIGPVRAACAPSRVQFSTVLRTSGASSIGLNGLVT